MRLFCPAQLNPFGHNPLRRCWPICWTRSAGPSARAPRLTVAATDVETGEAVLFDNAAITVEVLVASSCLPFVFPAVAASASGPIGTAAMPATRRSARC